MKPIKSTFETFPNGITAGVEYTRVIAGLNMSLSKNRLDLSRNSEKIDQNIRNLTGCEKTLIFKSYIEYGISVEDGAYEIASAPFNSPAKFVEFRELVNTKVFIGDSYVANSTFVNESGEEVYIDSGGEHVHVSCSQEVYEYICKMIWRNPEICWFMSEWHDDDSLSTYIFQNLRKYQNISVSKWTQPFAIKIMSGFLGRSNFPIYYRTEYKTCEFRFFQGSETTQNMIDNVELAVAITKACDTAEHSGFDVGFRSEFKSRTQRDIKKYAALPEKFHIDRFKTIIEGLGLPWDRYKKYIKNYKRRRAEGILA